MVALATAVLLVAGPTAAAPLGQIATVATGGATPGFTTSTRPSGIAAGPDGNVWFLESQPDPGAVARITPSGQVTEFPVPGSGFLSLDQITAGPDGAMWFTAFNTGEVFQVTTAGAVSLVAEPTVTPGFPSGNSEDIIAGPDGNIWVTRPSFNGSVADQLVRITPGGPITGFGAAAGLPADATLRELTVGPDGNLYIGDSGQGSSSNVANRIWRFDLTTDTFHLVATAGSTSGFTAGNFVNDITQGPDGNLWFLFGGTTAGIARLTTAGAVTEFTGSVSADADLSELTAACDGGLWITQSAESPEGGAIWRSGTDGTLTEYTAGLPAASNPDGITALPGADVWFTNPSDPGTINTVGTGCAAPPPPPGPPAPPTPIAVTPAFTG